MSPLRLTGRVKKIWIFRVNAKGEITHRTGCPETKKHGKGWAGSQHGPKTGSIQWFSSSRMHRVRTHKYPNTQAGLPWPLRTKFTFFWCDKMLRCARLSTHHVGHHGTPPRSQYQLLSGRINNSFLLLFTLITSFIKCSSFERISKFDFDDQEIQVTN